MKKKPYSKRLSHPKNPWQNTVWKTETGQLIKIKDLGDQHLQNIASFMLRNAVTKIVARAIAHDKFSSYTFPLSVPLSFHLPLSWEALVKEAKTRKLQIPKAPTKKELRDIVKDHLLLHGRS